jgi:hypothetical protein
MDERPPFDPVRAAFWVVVSVLMLYGLVIIVGLAGCALSVIGIVSATCDPRDKLSDLLAVMLSTALALYVGHKAK